MVTEDNKWQGLKVGLEIHQQLETGKLFCNCQSRFSEEIKDTFTRRLRPTQSEMGEVDAAALAEARRNLTFRYQMTPDTCLVEADEEPPHDLNPEALEVALTVAILLNARVADEVHVMRKLVIDGSTTTGFQRTALIATDGSIEVGRKSYGIPTIMLEEDASRKIDEGDGVVTYRLDRQGTSLIEISTTPEISTPEESAKVAARIGDLLRATRRVKRGLGTIREDLNISVRGGARCEIKGVQDLRMISTFVENEVGRQLKLIEVAIQLKSRGVTEVKGEPVDVSDVFIETDSEVMGGASRGGVILALPLRGFQGLLRDSLGPELANHARAAGVGGLMHSDELPGHGISQDETYSLRDRLSLDARDAFVIVADMEPRATHAIHEVLNRAKAALTGVPEETRDPGPDGRTVYSRPLPGKARMYPETDVPPVRIERSILENLSSRLPEMPEERVERLKRSYEIHGQQIEQLVESGMDDRFEELVKGGAEARMVATVLLYDFIEIEREGIDISQIPRENLLELFRMLGDGVFAKEALPGLLREMGARGHDPTEAVASLGIKAIPPEEVERLLASIVEENGDIVIQRGEEAFKHLMGKAMKELRGKIDGKEIGDLLMKRIRLYLAARSIRT